MNCMVCHSEEEVINISNLYVMGSEGLNICIFCRTNLSNHIRTLMTIAGRIRKESFKEVKK